MQAPLERATNRPGTLGRKNLEPTRKSGNVLRKILRGENSNEGIRNSFFIKLQRKYLTGPGAAFRLQILYLSLHSLCHEPGPKPWLIALFDEPSIQILSPCSTASRLEV